MRKHIGRNIFAAAAIALATAGAILAPTAFARDGGGHIDLRIVGITDARGVTIERPRENEPTVLSLVLHDRHSSRNLTPEDLLVSHEKLFHLFSFDAGLTNYVHEHPEYDRGTGTWKIAVTYKRAGAYKVWADITRRSDEPTPEPGEEGESAHGMATLSVAGESQPTPTPSTLQPRLRGSDGLSQVTLRADGVVRANTMAMYDIMFSRTDGSRPRITPYLGALAHVVIANLAGDELIHAHPMDMDGMLMLHTTFPAAGDYRAFVQFVDAGALKTVELNLRALPRR